MKYTLALMVFFTSIFALANDVYVTAKTYLGSPCYYTNTLSDIQVYYRGQDLENAKVELDYGFQMQNLYDGMIYNWTYKNLISFRKENDQYVAQIVGQTLHTRSASSRLERIQFVVKITYPDGQVKYDNGGNSRWGYFESRFMGPTNSCGSDEARYAPLQLVRVLKN